MPISSGDSSPYIHHVVHPFRPTMLFLCPRRLGACFNCQPVVRLSVPMSSLTNIGSLAGTLAIGQHSVRTCRPLHSRAKMEQSTGRASPVYRCAAGASCDCSGLFLAVSSLSTPSPTIVSVVATPGDEPLTTRYNHIGYAINPLWAQCPQMVNRISDRAH